MGFAILLDYSQVLAPASSANPLNKAWHGAEAGRSPLRVSKTEQVG